MENDALPHCVCYTEQMIGGVGGRTRLYDINPSTRGSPANHETCRSNEEEEEDEESV